MLGTYKSFVIEFLKTGAETTNIRENLPTILALLGLDNSTTANNPLTLIDTMIDYLKSEAGQRSLVAQSAVNGFISDVAQMFSQEELLNRNTTHETILQRAGVLTNLIKQGFYINNTINPKDNILSCYVHL